MKRNRALGYATVSILKAIEDGSRYGLDIMAATGLPSGTVYPTLASLDKRGLVRASWESARVATREGRPRRRYYQLTRHGDRALREALDRLGMLLSEPQAGAAEARTREV